MAKEPEKQPVKPRWAVIAEQLMEQQDLTQEDLKYTFGVQTRGAVGHYLRGTRRASVEQLMRLSQKLGVLTSELLGEIPLTADPREDKVVSGLLSRLSPKDRSVLIGILRGAASEMQQNKNEENQ